MRLCRLHILAFILSFLPVLNAYGSDSLRVRKLYHDVTVAASGGYNLPSHGYYRGYNELKRPIRANSSLHLEYSFGFSDATDLGCLYPGVTQGIGLSGCSFYNHELMGTPVFAYLFQNARILDLCPRLGLDYSWRLGTSYGWKQTELIASKWNVSVNVGLMLSYDVAKRWTLGIGPEFTHCSNGDTSYPNGGANLMNLRLSLTGHIVENTSVNDRSAIEKYESELRQKPFADRMTYDLILIGGYRAGKVTSGTYAIINEPFPFFGLNVLPQYHLNRIFAVGASLDLLADRSADIYDVEYNSEIREVTSYKIPELSQQMAAGLSLRGEINMPVFSVGVGVGSFLLGSSDNLKGIYTIYTLKAFVTERLFLNVTYRLSTRNYTHNLMYGLGWRFN